MLVCEDHVQPPIGLEAGPQLSTAVSLKSVWYAICMPRRHLQRAITDYSRDVAGAEQAEPGNRTPRADAERIVSASEIRPVETMRGSRGACGCTGGEHFFSIDSFAVNRPLSDAGEAQTNRHHTPHIRTDGDVSRAVKPTTFSCLRPPFKTFSQNPGEG